MKINKKNTREERFFSGLRSLGFQFPETELELNRFNEIYSDFHHELSGKEISPQKIIDEIKKEEKTEKYLKTKKRSQKSSNENFKRIVLAAEITSQLHNEPTFGHVKFQKLVYLCEQYAKINVQERYAKQAAGPYDRKFMHSIDYNFKKLKWFSVSRDSSSYKYTYEPMERLDNYKKYYRSYFHNYDKNIQWLIEVFRKSKTDFVELIATLHSCIQETIQTEDKTTKKNILLRFYSWSDEKKRFKKEKVEDALEWMYAEGLIDENIK